MKMPFANFGRPVEAAAASFVPRASNGAALGAMW
jgi:hypothetical protein